MPPTVLASEVSFDIRDFTFKSQEINITPLTRKGYELYSGCQISEQGKNWTPHICCNTCGNCFRDWLNGRSGSMPFAVSMI